MYKFQSLPNYVCCPITEFALGANDERCRKPKRARAPYIAQCDASHNRIADWTPKHEWRDL